MASPTKIHPATLVTNIKLVYQSNLMKIAPTLILGSLYSNFIVGLILWMVTFFLMTHLRHRLLKILNGNDLMTSFAHGFMVLLVHPFSNQLFVPMIVLLMLRLVLRTIFKIIKPLGFFILSLNLMKFLSRIFPMSKPIATNLKLLLLLLLTLMLLSPIIDWLFKFFMV